MNIHNELQPTYDIIQKILCKLVEESTNKYIKISSNDIEINSIFHLLNNAYKKMERIYHHNDNKSSIESAFIWYKIIFKKLFCILYECERLNILNDINDDLDEDENSLPKDLLNYKYNLFISKKMMNKEWCTQIFNEEIKHLYDIPKKRRKNKNGFIREKPNINSLDEYKMSFMIENRLIKIKKILRELMDSKKENMSVDTINKNILIEVNLIKLNYY